ncbi:MAG: hypothetical protein Q8936_23125 [Bacillota bacterium]|nr:hypothetical protein [Bacillota bacterium]
MSDEPQEQPQEQPQENIQTLKNEIKNELKEEFSNFRQKRKHRLIYSITVFALGLVIGFGGGMASHSEHGFGHGHVQEWHHMRK